jgi:hypothetical protein
MSLTIELDAADEARLTAAARELGLAPAELARKVLVDHLPEPRGGRVEDPTLLLFQQWAEEAAHSTPEEIAAENELWERFQHNVNATRRELGIRQL